MNRARDLVILKVDGRGLAHLPLNSASTPDVGEHVMAIGSPLGLEGTVSDGIVSALRQEPPDKRWIQTTAPVSRGNSGGPLLDMDGKVIGVVTWGVSLQEGQNLNFGDPLGRGDVSSRTTRPTDLLGLRGQRSGSRRGGRRIGADRVSVTAADEQHPLQQLRDIAEAIKKCPTERFKVPPGALAFRRFCGYTGVHQ